MSLSYDDYITLVSLGISSISLAVVIFLGSSVSKKLAAENHNIQTSPVSDKDVEVSAIVAEFTQRLRKLEESLVDQKVKMEILELRATRSSTAPVTYPRVEELVTSTPVENMERPAIERQGLIAGMRTPPQKGQLDQDKKLGVTEIEALRLVFEGRGKISAREIQQRIGRTREHTARMMSSLYHDGLVDRDVTARPFSYSITEKGRDVLNA
jgi:DNA-binding MarR family transcriptional regulator